MTAIGQMEDDEDVTRSDDEWNDESEVRTRSSRPPVSLDKPALDALVELAGSMGGPVARRRRRKVMKHLGEGSGPLQPLLRLLVARAQEVEDLRRLAASDELTGLANRRAFYEALQREISRARRRGGRLALLMLDLDALKMINDRFGHLAGDTAIEEVARCCQASVRDSDVVARLGGDEFAIILPEADAREAAAVGKRVRQRLGARRVSGVELMVSIGFAILDDSVVDGRALVAAADAALYANKRHRRSLPPSARE